MKIIAKELLEIKAVFLRPSEPYTWSSGIKSPIYCDNRLILSFPKTRDIVETELAKLVKEKFPEAQNIMGTATAGIAHAALVANILQLPMGYVRSDAKKHGRTNRIEGKLTIGEKVVVIEDLISTGGSSIDAVNALIEQGANVLGVVSIFTYNMKSAEENFMKAGIQYFSLTDFETLANVAKENKYISESELSRVLKWKENPKDESWINNEENY